MTAISDAERKKIQQEAQEILKRFSAVLAKVKLKKRVRKKAAGGWREEGAGRKDDADLRKRIFANAPHHNEDCIIAEKKQW